MSTGQRNADPEELRRFNALADRWWDPEGEMRMLHRMNPARMAFIERAVALTGCRALDVGCGAGLLAERLAESCRSVTGIDLARDALGVARLHAMERGFTNLEYRDASIESTAEESPAAWQVVTCMEMLEHVPDPRSIVRSCAAATCAGGHVFFSTIDRTPRAWLTAVVGAEYALGLLPKGTHRYEQFIRASELAAWGRACGLSLVTLQGLNFNFATGGFDCGLHSGINYIAHFEKPELPG